MTRKFSRRISSRWARRRTKSQRSSMADSIARWNFQATCHRSIERDRKSMDEKNHGLARGLTNYGDADFSRYLRRSFAKSTGFSAELLSRPVVGIAQAAGGFNSCHRHFPELIEAVK